MVVLHGTSGEVHLFAVCVHREPTRERIGYDWGIGIVGHIDVCSPYTTFTELVLSNEHIGIMTIGDERFVVHIRFIAENRFAPEDTAISTIGLASTIVVAGIMRISIQEQMIFVTCFDKTVHHWTRIHAHLLGETGRAAQQLGSIGEQEAVEVNIILVSTAANSA